MVLNALSAVLTEFETLKNIDFQGGGEFPLFVKQGDVFLNIFSPR